MSHLPRVGVEIVRQGPAVPTLHRWLPQPSTTRASFLAAVASGSIKIGFRSAPPAFSRGNLSRIPRLTHSTTPFGRSPNSTRLIARRVEQRGDQSNACHRLVAGTINLTSAAPEQVCDDEPAVTRVLAFRHPLHPSDTAVPIASAVVFRRRLILMRLGDPPNLVAV